jgi:catechol 2,3-dioxygenase-like lactoylglutathione lyase family enzyme
MGTSANPQSLVPELDVSDVGASIAFYRLLGFAVGYARPAEGFVHLARGGVQLMVQTANGPGRRFRTAPLEQPFGRGINLQLEVDDVEHVHAAVTAAGYTPLIDLEVRWYRAGSDEVGHRQFVVADPDGYLIRPYQALGRREAA